MIELIQGDCLLEMDKLIKQGITVDAIITDIPYGTTACKWDTVIPFDEMWSRLNKLVKPSGAIVLFGSEPFSSALRMSNIKKYKYDWIWNKNKCGSPGLAKIRPLKTHEIISVFCNGVEMYNPIMEQGDPYFRKRSGKIRANNMKYGFANSTKDIINTGVRYPKSIINISRDFSAQQQIHPTQKPVALMEYLIKTYTNENELVLDFTMGSGSTGIACKNLNRRFIGIELDENYFNIAKERIND